MSEPAELGDLVAYLVRTTRLNVAEVQLREGLAKMGRVLTPYRAGVTTDGLTFSLDNRRKFAGTKQAGWVAYNISTDRETGIGDWKPVEIARYIGSGHAPGRGTADGPMGVAAG